jgi:5-formyltetrahydrofolate cyclo-ligase
MEIKQELRSRLRRERREYAKSIPDNMRGLLFLRPPRMIVDRIPDNATVGVYHASPAEAPASAYGRFFVEAEHAVALPWFSGRDSEMIFRRWSDPFAESDLESGPYEILQPSAHAEIIVPDVVFVPLLGFTQDGRRLGQGGGHYDRWLASHPNTLAIGLAWDCQLVETLPIESHDHPLAAVITPTRLFGAV